MKRNDTREGNSTATTVYRILQSPAPICMFYFAHPFGISSPAATVSTSTSKSMTTASKQPPAAPPPTKTCDRKPVPLPVPKYDHQRQPSKTEIVRQRPDTRDGGGGGGGGAGNVVTGGPQKKTNGMTVVRQEKVVAPPKVTTPGGPAVQKTNSGNRGKLKRSKNCPTESVTRAAPPAPLTVKPHAKTKKRSNVIEMDRRQAHLTPWPSTIWNRDFLIPPLLQVLAKQHGRKIPDIEQILRTVRSAWNTPKSQRSLLQSQDSRDSSASNWDLSSSCDSHYCDQGRLHHHGRMGAGTYAIVSGPGLLRRRYSVPEIIMRKHTLAQQKPSPEELLLCDTNHNNIGAANKNPCYQPSSPSPYSPHSPSPQQQQSPQLHQVTTKAGPLTRANSKGSPHRKSMTRAASSVDGGGNHVARTPPSPLISTGSESNLAAMKVRQGAGAGGPGATLGGISRNQKCSSVNGINSSTFGVNGVGGSLGGALGGQVPGSGADFSMRKSTLLRRMWSKEMRRYDRSGSWSPPLRRAPRRIYSIESILPPDGVLGGGGGSGASSDGGSSCVTTSATSCKECAKLESQYNGNTRAGKLAQESPKRLRLAASLGNINNNLQKVDFVEGGVEVELSCNSTPSNRNLISSETTTTSKPEISSTTGTAVSTPLIRAAEKTTSKSRGFVFMSAASDVELDEADLSSSTTSSIASQACARPVGRPAGSTGTILEASEEGTLIDNDDDASTIPNVRDNESLSEFLAEEAAQTKHDCEDPVAGAVQRGRDTDARVHPRERDKTPSGDAPPGQAAPVNGQFPLKKPSRRGSNASSSALSAADSTDSESVYNDEPKNESDSRLDEYISNLLVDNLNNLLDTSKELVTVGGTFDQKNNNQVAVVEESKSIPQGETVEPSEMKQKPDGKYIGGGGGVVCNSPPDPGSKLKHQLSKESEKENEDTINNNQTTTTGKVNINYVRKKNGLGEKKSNGFYLVPKNGSRDSDGLPSEIDLNGKYYFPTYGGVETDPSDHTDIASEPEVQILGKIGTGNVTGRYGIVPRISALPRTESMEVQPSSTSAEEEFDDELRNGSDSDTPSLVDSLDEVEIAAPQRQRQHRKKSLAPPSPAPAEPASAPETTTKSETSSSAAEKSPRHEKGEAFFVPIQDTAAVIDIVVADAMPLRIKERLNNRQRLMIWRKEQESLKKHRKIMRMIEQKKFYGEPAIQVISTIDRAISRKEFIPPSEKKRVFGQGVAVAAGPFTPKVNKTKKKNAALRTELGMLESYKIDARGNMQIQNPGSSSGGPGSGKKGGAKSPWGQAAERRQTKVELYAPTSSSAKSTLATATSASSKTPKKTPIDPRRKQVLKDVQQMTLYQQPDLTPDIEGGPRRMYQKTEIQEGDKHIEILEIVECADSAPGGGGGGYHRRAPRVRSAGRSGNKRSRIPVPIYKWGRYRRSNYSRENSPLTGGAGSNPKVDRMIADLLIEALSNPDDVGVKFIKSPEELKDKSKRSPNNRKPAAANNPANASSNTPHRSANSGKYTQRFEVIPEERSSVSVGSSSEELSAAGRKKHASPRRVSFEENHKILNLDEFQQAPPPPKGALSPSKMTAPSPKPSPKASPAKTIATSPKAPPALKKTSTTTSRGKAAIQSEVVEEKGWIGFTTQHEDLATPVNGGGGEEDEEPPPPPLRQPAEQHARSRTNLVKTIITGNTARHDRHVVDHFHHHHAQSVTTTDAVRMLTAGSVTSVDRIRSTVATVGSVHDHQEGGAIATTIATRLTSAGEFSDAESSCFTDSLNTKPSPMPRELAIPVQLEEGHPTNEYKSTAETVKEVGTAEHCDCSDSIVPYRQIREENAWHVYESGDCKVIQSKIEYYETSIHRTPLTETALFGNLADRTPESLRSALLKSNFDNLELVRHEPVRAEDSRTHPTSADTLLSAIPALRTPALSEEPPKTSETCSSCCFCNPELHKHNGNPPDNCFYCQTKAHTPSKHFPAPPTPPNIQMSPIPPSPKTPIMELTPTPTLQEIPLPGKKPPETSKPDNPQDPVSENLPSTTTTTTTSINGLYTETTKKTDHTHTKTKTKTSDSTKCTKTNEKIKRSYVPSTAGPTDSEHQAPPPLEEVSKKLTRKKSETTVLNRPKNINNLNRPPTVVHTVQKEVKNELKTPIKVLPKTAKEFSNRKERDKQITLNLPLDPPKPKPKHPTTEKSKTTLGFEAPKDPKTSSTNPRCPSSQSYDETTCSSSSSSNSSSTSTSPNSSPFKKCTASAADLPPAASRWKHNSERNLTQLTMQKITTASKWGNKWRKAARQHEHSPAPADVGLSPIRSVNGASGQVTAGASATTTATTNHTAASVGTAAAAMVPPASIIGGISQSTSNQGWTVTVAGNYNPDMAPDVEMRLSFPKQPQANSASAGMLTNGGSPARRGASAKRINGQPSVNGGSMNGHGDGPRRHQQQQQYIEDTHHIPGRGGQNYALLDDDSYVGNSRGTARAALPPPPPAAVPHPVAGLNPKRTLSRADGHAGGGGGGGGGKDYRLPNVGTSTNVPGRQTTTKKGIKTMAIVASATTRTVAKNYHMLSHQHEHHQQQQQHHFQPAMLPSSPSYPYYHHQHQQSLLAASHGVGPPGTTTTTMTSMTNGTRGGGGGGGGRPRASSFQSLHPSSLQNGHGGGGGGGGKYLPSNSHQPRYHDPSSAIDYGSNAYYGGSRRMSLDSPHGNGGGGGDLSVMGNAIAPEHKPKVPTMSERDLTRRHNPCYTRNQPYFS